MCYLWSEIDLYIYIFFLIDDDNIVSLVITFSKRKNLILSPPTTVQPLQNTHALKQYWFSNKVESNTIPSVFLTRSSPWFQPGWDWERNWTSSTTAASIIPTYTRQHLQLCSFYHLLSSKNHYYSLLIRFNRTFSCFDRSFR